ncbi:efflux RND transporter periplasmic adaptor subunit [Sinomicrobium pectinilyticum]|uniref:Efflux RND transporter periplasmic adaptor subunit n=1 Tax=Sinomicrobium pectinilyticum TaxID=1084421 RepID=A0A3N0EEI8_SINP1|nr:efflux RND transporter periplasmic adaptor subunit [Sinomicrobium pectinilyticum]RNL86290.1 efflux RND transporter periplasmic adaptor subunit [Sinomicrobium pectinilyticum]
MRINQVVALHLSYFLIILSALFFSGCTSDRKNNKRPSPQAVEVAVVKKHSVNTLVSLSGNVEGKETLRLGFMVAGRVNHVAIQEGESIQKGALLASLDDTDYSIGLEAANGKLLEVQDKYDRLKIMHDRNSISEADFVEVKAGLQQALAQHKLRMKNVKDTRLYAPITGVLLKKGVSEGEVIDKGMPVFGLADIDQVKINAAVPENDIHRIKLHQEARVTIPALDTVYTGKVIEVGLAAEATTRTYNARILLENPGHRILPGMIAEILIDTNQKTEALTVPGHAILRDPDNSIYVYILDENKNRAFKRSVSVGKLYKDQMEITSGLEEGEQVVTGGQQKLYDGMDVTLKQGL